MVSGHLDVTVGAPAGTPRVLDQKVVLTVVDTITDSQNSVVDRGTAPGVDIDTARVELESSAGSVDSNTDWADISDSLGELVFRSFGRVTAVFFTADRVGRVVVAGSGPAVARGVWVRFFGVNTTVDLDVVETVVDPTTVASHVIVRTEVGVRFD